MNILDIVVKKLNNKQFYLYELDKDNLMFVRNRNIYPNSSMQEYKEQIFITEILDNLKIDYKIGEDSRIEIFKV